MSYKNNNNFFVVMQAARQEKFSARAALFLQRFFEDASAISTIVCCVLALLSATSTPIFAEWGDTLDKPITLYWPSIQNNSIAVSDDNGGVIIVYKGTLSFPLYDYTRIFAQRITVDGEVKWKGNYIYNVVDVGGKDFKESISTPTLKSDGKGGAFIVWVEDYDVHVQHIYPDGSLQWNYGGKIVGQCSTVNKMVEVQVSEGSATVYWTGNDGNKTDTTSCDCTVNPIQSKWNSPSPLFQGESVTVDEPTGGTWTITYRGQNDYDFIKVSRNDSSNGLAWTKTLAKATPHVDSFTPLHPIILPIGDGSALVAYEYGDPGVSDESICERISIVKIDSNGNFDPGWIRKYEGYENVIYDGVNHLGERIDGFGLKMLMSGDNIIFIWTAKHVSIPQYYDGTPVISDKNIRIQCFNKDGNLCGFKLTPEKLAYCDKVTSIPQKDCEALAYLYYNTMGFKWGRSYNYYTYSGWSSYYAWFDESAEPEYWRGIEYYDSFTLYLNGLGLTGTLSERLGDLSKFVEIHLGNNNLIGRIPSELGNLTQLKFLDLSGNQLCGEIPTSLKNLTQLEYLRLDSNHLTLPSDALSSGLFAFLKQMGVIDENGVFIQTQTPTNYCPPQFIEKDNYACIIGKGEGKPFSWMLSLNGVVKNGDSVTAGSSTSPESEAEVADKLADDMTSAFSDGTKIKDDGEGCIKIGNYTLYIGKQGETSSPPMCEVTAAGCQFNPTVKLYSKQQMISKIRGFLWNDLNGNGLQDANEAYLTGWTVVLKNTNGSEISTVTDVNGYYEFTDLVFTGNYTITVETRTGATYTTPQSVVRTVDFVNIPRAVNFGIKLPKVNLTVTKSGGNGTVTSTPAGISCGDDCSEDYALNTQVKLTAVADVGYSFKEWSGGSCSGTSSEVTVTTDVAKTCNAMFESAIPKIAVSPTPLTFVNIGIGYPATKTVTVSNIGGGILDIGTITIPVSTIFSIQNDNCSNKSLTSSSTCTFNMVFSPNSPSLRTLTLSVPSNDVTKKIIVSGNGVPVPNVSLSEDSIDFGNTDIGSSSSKTLTISNTGQGSLNVESVGLTNSTDFVLQANTCQTVSANNTCAITVAFSPTSTGLKESVLSIKSNSYNSPNNIRWFGSGKYPIRNLTVVKQGTGTGTVTAHDNGIICGNDCADPYDLNSTVTLTATPNDNYTAVSWSEPGCVGNICQVKMTTDKIVMATFNPVPNIRVIQFNGTELNYNDTLDLGVALAQSGQGQALLIMNLGIDKDVAANLEITGFTFEGTNANDFEVVGRAFPLMWWDNRACNVSGTTSLPTYHPNRRCGVEAGVKANSSIGVKTATLVIHTNDPDTPLFRINLRSEVISKSEREISDVACSLEPTIISDAKNPYIDGKFWGLWSYDDSSGDSGDWYRPSNPFNKPMIPQTDDVVLIKSEHTMIGMLSPVKVKALCNKGILLSAEDASLSIEATAGISNYGTITGNSELSLKDEQPCGQKDGNNVILKAGIGIIEKGDWIHEGEVYGLGAPIYNVGIIKAGDGGDGDSCSGKGGQAFVIGRNVINDAPVDNDGKPILDSNGNPIIGIIRAGNGGSTSASGIGGAGGETVVWGRVGGPGYLINNGEIYSGNGGDGCNGGNGGSLGLYADPNLVPGKINGEGSISDTTQVAISGSSQYSETMLKIKYGALPGANIASCSAPANLTKGTVWLEPSVIKFTTDAKVFGGDVVIFGGENWVLNLSKSNRILVDATGDITLQVGKNSVVDLSGNNTKVLKAAGKVTILSDNIRLDEGVKLSDIIQATEIVTGPSKIRYSVSLMSIGKTIGKPNTVLPLKITLGNSGPKFDTYNLSVSSTANWQISSIEPSVSLDGLDLVDLPLNVTLPDSLGAVNVITVKATSTTDPSVTATTEVVIEVTDGKIVMPDLNYTVSGIVLDKSGNPIEGVTVQIGGKTATTDATGKWEIKDLPKGSYVATADKDGYTFGDEVVTLADNLNITLSIKTMTEPSFTSGIFTVDSKGIVKIDFLYDGGKFQGEFGIFNLAGMETLTPGSPEFIAEAVKRVLSNTDQGYVVFSDLQEGARFSGLLGGEVRDWNTGDYKGVKSFAMKPGSQFGTVLVPNSTFASLAQNPGTSDTNRRPLFSLVSSNPAYGMYLGQMADINGMGKAFAYEDKNAESSDWDFNDLIVMITGADSNLPALDSLVGKDVSRSKREKRDTAFTDWRTGSELGKLIMSHIEASAPTEDSVSMTVTLNIPATLLVYDPAGKVMGKEGGTIAGADFSLNADGSQTVTLNSLNPGDYRIIVQSAAEVQGTLTVRTYQGSAEISSGDAAVSLAPHQTMTLTVPADSVSASRPITLKTPVSAASYDFSGDGVVDNADVAMAVRHWNSCRNQQKYDPFYDLDEDGCITVADVMKVLNAKTVK